MLFPSVIPEGHIYSFMCYWLLTVWSVLYSVLSSFLREVSAVTNRKFKSNHIVEERNREKEDSSVEADLRVFCNVKNASTSPDNKKENDDHRTLQMTERHSPKEEISRTLESVKMNTSFTEPIEFNDECIPHKYSRNINPIPNLRNPKKNQYSNSSIHHKNEYSHSRIRKTNEKLSSEAQITVKPIRQPFGPSLESFGFLNQLKSEDKKTPKSIQHLKQYQNRRNQSISERRMKPEAKDAKFQKQKNETMRIAVEAD